MKDNFTEQQREIVARKMGFDGPMQNFGEFLMSSPSTASKYSAVAMKLGEKAQAFAAGGAVAKGGVANIISAGAEKKGMGGKDTVAAMYELLQMKAALLLRELNTVVVLEKLQPSIVAVHFFTTDTGEALMAATSAIVTKLAKSDIKQFYGENEDTELLQVLQQKGVKLLPSDVPEFDWRVVKK